MCNCCKEDDLDNTEELHRTDYNDSWFKDNHIKLKVCGSGFLNLLYESETGYNLECEWMILYCPVCGRKLV